MKLKRCLAFLAWATLLLGHGAGVLAQEPVLLTREDGQAVHLMAYAPTRARCRGVALVSPGAGGSEQGYAYLGDALSRLGYLTVVIGHPESGREVLRQLVRDKGIRDGLAALITHPPAYRGRFMDITAAGQWARARCEGGEKILVGHSMGAATVMMEAGARNRLGLNGADAFDAYIALSPQGSGLIFEEEAWSKIARPVLIITGTQDIELESGTWQSRTRPFASMPAGCKWLAVIEGATHMAFAGIGPSQNAAALSTRLAGAFLEGTQRGDCTVREPPAGVTLQSK